MTLLQNMGDSLVLNVIPSIKVAGYLCHSYVYVNHFKHHPAMARHDLLIEAQIYIRWLGFVCMFVYLFIYLFIFC